ncbi:acyltransferase [Amycolatopsis alkalitolerans]|uniref:Acyltransferase n=2 Tax=Amycolatopsis alkalitolerans TaxID=2547244 RepID=A0A5C4M5J9_9PSEU|nr:acyltransferase [Amycolatopsis alkalitolerans]
MTVGAVVNGVLGSALMPRPLRLAGYRLLGARVRSGNIFPGLRVYGSMRNLEIGRRTFVNAECYLEPVAPIRIGEACQFGPQAMIVTSHHPRMPDGTVSRVSEGRAVRIGDRVWVGARAQILPGVTIADDVVIAAGAVVTRDCPVPGVYAGVPARLVRETSVAT